MSECGGGRNALEFSRAWSREEDVGRDAIGKGTHRLRDEEREDAGDGGAASRRYCGDAAARDGGGVGAGGWTLAMANRGEVRVYRSKWGTSRDVTDP